MIRSGSRRVSGALPKGSREGSLVTADLVDAKVESAKAELRLDMAEAVSEHTVALKELGAEVCIAIEKQNATIEKQNATIEKQNAAIEKQGAEFTVALKELGAEVRIAIAKQNAVIEKQGAEYTAAIAKQNAVIEKQNAAIEKQNAAIEKQGAEHTAALAKHSSALDQRLTTRTYWMFGAVTAGYLTLFGSVIAFLA